ncbi:MAG: hypothetical protein M3Q79_04720 [bacterium]|nr:hypothetical protein [bacterium]
MTQNRFIQLCWGLVIMAFTVPFIAWLQNGGLSRGSLSIFSIFPLLGLWAWLLMWTHYITGSVRQHYGLERNVLYSKYTSWAVLVLILLHPSLITYKLFSIGEGLPPGSVINYVGEAQKISYLFGTLALLIFLSYEVFKRLKDRDFVKNNTHIISISQAVGMILIFVHALRLGNHLDPGWFKIFWIMCGLVLVPAMAYLIDKDIHKVRSRGR